MPGFPNNREEMTIVLSNQQAAAHTAELNARRYKEAQKKHELFADILKRLQTSWQEFDPGKYGPAYFFLHSHQNERVIVREFLAAGTKIYSTPEEWKERDEKSNRFHNNDVPPWRTVVHLSEVRKSECKTCKAAQPVIEHYDQTFDSPMGDEWLKEHFVLCLHCNIITTLTSKTTHC